MILCMLMMIVGVVFFVLVRRRRSGLDAGGALDGLDAGGLAGDAVLAALALLADEGGVGLLLEEEVAALALLGDLLAELLVLEESDLAAVLEGVALGHDELEDAGDEGGVEVDADGAHVGGDGGARHLGAPEDVRGGDLLAVDADAEEGRLDVDEAGPVAGGAVAGLEEEERVVVADAEGLLDLGRL